MVVPPMVSDLVAAYLQAVDVVAPGLIDGFYLTGSVALDDFQVGRGLARLGPSGAGVSDVDFVAVTARAPGDTAISALQRIHRRLAGARRPSLDGIYLTWGDLSRDPSTVAGRPQSHSGRLDLSGRGHPVLWHEMADHAVAVRGPSRSTVPIHTDHEQLIAWVRGNLDGYWRRWHLRSSQALSRQGMIGLTPWASTWGVLGVSRLHHTIRTGRICSKTAGGHHARREFNEPWYPILDECLRIRSSASRRSHYANPVPRRRDSLAFVDMVIGAGIS